jgi:hypothetical protein
MPKAKNRLLSAPARDRGGDKRPSPGPEEAKSPLVPPAQCPPAEPRAGLAHPLASGLVQAPGSPASLLSPHPGATSLKAPASKPRGRAQGPGRGAWRSGIP